MEGTRGGDMRKLLSGTALATSGSRLLPNYLIIGGKRCGSTSLQEYLAAHPAVLPPHSGKGTRYFDVNYCKGMRWFRAHYPTERAARRRAAKLGTEVVTGEASPYYCFHPTALERIAATLPRVNLLFMLRDPVARAYSQWAHESKLGFEHLDVLSAFDAEEERIEGEEERLRADPCYVSFAHRHHAYLSRGHYAEQLARLYALFPAEQVLVLSFERFFSDSSAGMAEVLAFLNLPEHRLSRFGVHKAARYQPMPSTVRKRLEDYYEPHNRRLAEDFGVYYFPP